MSHRMHSPSTAFLAAFSPRGRCGCRAYWGHMLLLSLGYTFLFTLYLLCIFACDICGGSLTTYRCLLYLLLALTHLFSQPAGALALLPGRSLLGFACPPYFPEPTPLQSLLFHAGVVLSLLGMLVLTARATALALRRLRDAGQSPWVLALMALIPVAGSLILMGLLTFPSQKEPQGSPGSPPAAPAPLSRRAWWWRSLPMALLCSLCLIAGELFLVDVGTLYRNHVDILLLLCFLLLAIPAVASHPLPCLAVLLGLFGAQMGSPHQPLLATGQGAVDTAMAAALTLGLLVSCWSLCRQAGQRLHDSGAAPQSLLAFCIPFVLLFVLVPSMLEGGFTLTTTVLLTLWLCVQGRLLLRPGS